MRQSQLGQRVAVTFALFLGNVGSFAAANNRRQSGLADDAGFLRCPPPKNVYTAEQYI